MSILSAREMQTPIEPRRARRASPAEPLARGAAVFADASRRIEVAVASSCGRDHAVNEDAHSGLAGSGRLFVVADGVGGGAMAQVASRMLVGELHAALAAGEPDGARIDRAILSADRAIAAAIARVTDRPGAATVVLAAAIGRSAAEWIVAWVGDCRAYRWTAGAAERIVPLTLDDTFRNLGEAPPAGGSPDDPARMVGNGATMGAHSALQTLAAGELLALCSDGVHKHVAVADFDRVLAQRVALAARAEQLVALARSQGSADDATVLLVERGEPGVIEAGGVPAGVTPGSRP